MTRLAVVADDWTGALEVAALFPGAVARFADQGLALAGTEPVSVLVTDGRHADATDAAARVTALAGDPALSERFFLKTDSTLRGNPGAELSAVARARNAVVVYTPANPAQGRTCAGGRLEVDGQSLEHTDFARDLFHAAQTGDVLGILGWQATVPVHRVPHAAAVAPIVAAGGPAIVLCDVRTEWDLAELAREAVRLGAPLAGSGGLARALAAELGVRRAAVRTSPCRSPLVVCGSRHAAALALAEEAEWAGIATLRLEEEPDTARAGARLAATLGTGAPALLTDAAPGTSPPSAGAARAHADRLGAATAAALALRPVDVLVVIGGDTLGGVLRALGRPALTSLGEALPGITACTAVSPALTLFSRPGGFVTAGGWRAVARALGLK